MMKPPRYLPDVPARQGRTAVYRLYDRRRRLLYVGITNSLKHRFAQHASDKPWWREVSSRTVRWHGTRREALEAEWRAIKTEAPIHNVQHNDNYRRGTRVRRASYRRPITTMIIATALIAGGVSGTWQLSAIMWAVTTGALCVAGWLVWGRAVQ
jgi:excinuclease UvrABC nuclease subunit